MNTVLLELKARPDNTVWKALSIQRAPFFLSFFSTGETEEEEKPAHFASSIQLQNKQLFKVSYGKPPAEAAAGGFWFARVQQAASFPRALVVVCHLVSTRSAHTHKHGQTHTHTHTHKLARSWWREQVRESCTCCPVNKIPQSDAETSSFTQRSFPQVWEHECGTKHADCHQPELTRRPGSKAASATWRPPGPQRSSQVLPFEIQVKLLLEIQVLKADNHDENWVTLRVKCSFILLLLDLLPNSSFLMWVMYG